LEFATGHNLGRKSLPAPILPVPGFRAVISQAAVTRLTPPKRGSINADSHEKTSFPANRRMSKRCHNGLFQRLDTGEIIVGVYRFG
jgi:hypothetical protein